MCFCKDLTHWPTSWQIHEFKSPRIKFGILDCNELIYDEIITE